MTALKRIPRDIWDGLVAGLDHPLAPLVWLAAVLLLVTR